MVILDETTAGRYWPDQDPLGARIRFLRTDGPWHRVVGVVSDAHWDGLEVPPGSFYHPLAQLSAWAPFHAREATLLVRSEGDPGALAAAAREIVRAADPNLPVRPIGSLAEVAAGAAAPRRFLAAFAGGFAGIALAVGAVGILGLLAHETARRRREIGIRLSLGAQTADIVRSVVRRGALLACLGTVFGLVVALPLRRLVAGLLFDVSPADPAAVFLAALAGVLAGILAAAVPAIRGGARGPGHGAAGGVAPGDSDTPVARAHAESSRTLRETRSDGSWPHRSPVARFVGAAVSPVAPGAATGAPRASERNRREIGSFLD